MSSSRDDSFQTIPLLLLLLVLVALLAVAEATFSRIPGAVGAESLMASSLIKPHVVRNLCNRNKTSCIARNGATSICGRQVSLTQVDWKGTSFCFVLACTSRQYDESHCHQTILATWFVPNRKLMSELYQDGFGVLTSECISSLGGGTCCCHCSSGFLGKGMTAGTFCVCRNCRGRDTWCIAHDCSWSSSGWCCCSGSSRSLSRCFVGRFRIRGRACFCSRAAADLHQ